jgi:hypothetical protein
MFPPVSALLLQVAPVADRWLTDTTTAFAPKLAPEHVGGTWIHALMFVSFTMLVLLRVFDFRRLVLLFQGFVRASSVSQTYREESALTSRVSVFLLLNFLLMGGLFTWQTLGVIFKSYPEPSAVLWISFGILCMYVVKIISVRILGFIFEMREAAQEYIYNVVLFNKTVGLILFPVTLCLAYARQLPPDWMVGIGLVFWGLILVYRFVRLSWIGLSVRGVSFLYIILYLCTLEILPFIVIIKMLKQFA